MGRRVAAEIAVHTIGEVAVDAREYVRRQIAALTRRIAGRLSAARVKLTVVHRPSVMRPALAQDNLHVDGHPVRAQVAAAFVHEAGGLLRTRLSDQVARLVGLWAPRAAHDREIVRRKICELARCAARPGSGWAGTRQVRLLCTVSTCWTLPAARHLRVHSLAQARVLARPAT